MPTSTCLRSENICLIRGPYYGVMFVSSLNSRSLVYLLNWRIIQVQFLKIVGLCFSPSLEELYNLSTSRFPDWQGFEGTQLMQHVPMWLMHSSPQDWMWLMHSSPQDWIFKTPFSWVCLWSLVFRWLRTLRWDFSPEPGGGSTSQQFYKISTGCLWDSTSTIRSYSWCTMCCTGRPVPATYRSSSGCGVPPQASVDCCSLASCHTANKWAVWWPIPGGHGSQTVELPAGWDALPHGHHHF
jgi:hypothetical protein